MLVLNFSKYYQRSKISCQISKIIDAEFFPCADIRRRVFSFQCRTKELWEKICRIAVFLIFGPRQKKCNDHLFDLVEHL